ncbi:AraC family transcriptional regulator [Paenibacillus oceani]|uniref:Helix-turn-helix domain-containing protein n=1 Tax=Paenibacillus oceani TaxID=2772510 RepID=A0A927CCL9_9BACL|nr:AraC family transcriptional regulator [Paenibacillus oceani]MBD2863501.1 helix-turn-helix domain-containing protein [Paenibacillus oceani]
MYPIFQDVLIADHAEIDRLPFFINKNRIYGLCPLHYHDFMELSLVYEGTGTEIVNGKRHRMQPGTVSVLLPHHVHEIHTEGNAPIRLYCCMFDMNFIFDSPYDAVFKNYLLKTGTQLPSHYDLNAEQSKRVGQILELLYMEYRGTAFSKHSYIRTKLIEAIVYIIRTRMDHINPKLKDGQTIRDPVTANSIKEMVQYVHVHYKEALCLKVLSEKFSFSVPYISQLFKEQVGQNFIDYLHALRIKRATSLLVRTRMSVHDIALDVGFSHIRTFTRVFREVTGLSAREYRNQKRRAIESSEVDR